jgi:hypothetical protein
MENQTNDLMTAMLAQGDGKVRVRLYTDGSGVPGSQVLSVEPWSPGVGQSLFGNMIGFIMLSVIAGLVLAVAIIGVAAVVSDGKGTGGPSDAIVAIGIYSGIGLGILLSALSVWAYASDNI